MGREGEKRIWPQTLWRFDSGARETAPVEEHLARLEFQLPPKELLRVLPPGSKISIDIAVFFDTMTVSTCIPLPGLDVIHRYRAAVEISCYPTDFGRGK
ncbi:MAG TPA: hypothetical protein VMU41_12585 [Candidatus Binataceae bacterium]|nr:hypothetical protein [Candidatus Binataceae bacterium]